MAELSFPSNPTVGQTYTSGTSGWVWTGTVWDAVIIITDLAGGSIGTIPYQSATSTTAQLAAGTAGQVLTSNGAAAPLWSAIPWENDQGILANRIFS